MSYQGGLDYMPVETVDEQADVTQMMGQASVMNHQGARRLSVRTNPTHALIALWVTAFLSYTLLRFTFRRWLA